jgi:hypothetical protein
MTNARWRRNEYQFPRLLAEINACVNIDHNDWEQLKASMDLNEAELKQLFDRAGAAWEKIKKQTVPPPKAKRPPHLYIEDDGILHGDIQVDLDEIIDNNLEGFLDLISDRLTKSECLSDIGYQIVGFTPPITLHLEVWGDPSMCYQYNPEIEKLWRAYEKLADDRSKSQARHQRKHPKKGSNP